MNEPLSYALNLIAEGVLSVDADGRIWRHKTLLPTGPRNLRQPRRAESIGGNGYLSIVLWIDGHARRVGAHRVVWAHLNGPIPDGMQINHKDLNKKNNHPSNLEIVTGAENIQHSYKNGRRHPWSDATTWRGKPRLTAEQIAEARRLRADGVPLREIAARLNIGTTHAQRITA